MQTGTLKTFFFNARGEELEKSTLGIYRSLLFQLIEGLPQLKAIFDSPGLMKPGAGPQEWTIESLKELFEEVVLHLEDESVTCFIDALDECNEDETRTMVSFFERISEATTLTSVSFQVCFSSRHYPHITISKAVSLILEGQEGHKDDIANCVSSELKTGNNKMAQQLVLFAKKPLSPQELYFALLSTEGSSEWDPETETLGSMDRFILDSSKGLAEVTISKILTVQFIHESVTDFLLKHNGLGQIRPEFGNNFQGQCHERLKHCCLNYVAVATAMRIGNSLPQVLPKEGDELRCDQLRKEAEKRLPFLRYATQQVLYQSYTAEGEGVSQLDFLQKFDLASWIVLDNLFEKHKIRRHTSQASLLYIPAEQNRANLIKTERSKLECFKIEGERYGTPILAALVTESSDAVHAFLTAQKDANPRSAALRDLELYHSPRRKFGFTHSRNRGIFPHIAELGDDTILALLFELGEAGADTRDRQG